MVLPASVKPMKKRDSNDEGNGEGDGSDSGGDGKCGAGCLRPAVIAAETANVARDA